MENLEIATVQSLVATGRLTAQDELVANSLKAGPSNRSWPISMARSARISMPRWHSERKGWALKPPLGVPTSDPEV